MPKTTAASPAQALAEEVERLQDAIATKERELVEQQHENTEFAEMLRLLSAGVAPFVATGRLPLMDAVSNLLEESSNQEDRNFRWNACQRALRLGQESAACLSVEIAQLRERLAIALEELDWIENYAPFADQYRSGFMMPSPEAIKDQKVQALKSDISDRQCKLQNAQAWLNQREGERPYYPGDALREATYLEQAIPVLNAQLQCLIAAPVAQDAKYEASFRHYVKARVEVQPVLDPFLEAQEQYLAALEQLKNAIATHPEAVQFPAAALGQPRVVSGDNGSIRLV